MFCLTAVNAMQIPIFREESPQYNRHQVMPLVISWGYERGSIWQNFPVSLQRHHSSPLPFPKRLKGVCFSTCIKRRVLSFSGKTNKDTRSGYPPTSGCTPQTVSGPTTNHNLRFPRSHACLPRTHPNNLSGLNHLLYCNTRF